MKKIASMVLVITLSTVTLNASCGVGGAVACAGTNIVKGALTAVGTVVSGSVKLVGCTFAAAGKVVATGANTVVHAFTPKCHCVHCCR